MSKSRAEPRMIHIQQCYFALDELEAIIVLARSLLKAQRQFSVGPWPDDIKSTRQTHWLVSWPADRPTQRAAA